MVGQFHCLEWHTRETGELHSTSELRCLQNAKHIWIPDFPDFPVLGHTTKMLKDPNSGPKLGCFGTNQ